MKNRTNHPGVPHNDSQPAKNDFTSATVNGSVHIGDVYNYNTVPPNNAGSPPDSEQPPGEEAKESRTNKKVKAMKIFSIGVGTISLLSIIAFMLVRCKDELTQDGLIAVCEAISGAFSFFSLLFSK